MKINKLIFLVLSLMFITGCRDNTEEKDSKPTPAGSSFVTADRLTYLRPLDRTTPLKVLIDLWQVRKNLDANIVPGGGLHFYNAPAFHGGLRREEQANADWLELNSENFYHGIERIMGYSPNSFWKYYRFIHAWVENILDVTTFEVANTDEGRAFVNDLRACHYNDISVGRTFVTTLFENELAVHPHSTCIKTAFQNAYGNDYFIAGGDGDHDLNTFLPGSPFILRERTVPGFINPIMLASMSSRTLQESEYIAYLKTKVMNRFEYIMNTNSSPNTGCRGAVIPSARGVIYGTCVSRHHTVNLNALLDNEYITYGGATKTSNFIAKERYERRLIDAVFSAIERANEADFINATAKLAASHPFPAQRSTVLDTFSDLFVTKDFPTMSTFSSYLHFLLNCTQFH